MSRQPAACGTPSGYRAHKRRGETICDPCRRANSAAAKAHRDYSGDDDVPLTGGRWVRDGLVMRWQKDPEVYSVPTLADGVACPKCGAGPTETCRSKGGHRAHNHVQRVTPRLCPECGDPAQYRGTYCLGCSPTARAEVWVEDDVA